MVREMGGKMQHRTEIGTQWIRKMFGQDTRVRVSVAQVLQAGRTSAGGGRDLSEACEPSV